MIYFCYFSNKIDLTLAIEFNNAARSVFLIVDFFLSNSRGATEVHGKTCSLEANRVHIEIPKGQVGLEGRRWLWPQASCH